MAAILHPPVKGPINYDVYYGGTPIHMQPGITDPSTTAPTEPYKLDIESLPSRDETVEHGAFSDESIVLPGIRKFIAERRLNKTEARLREIEEGQQGFLRYIGETILNNKSYMAPTTSETYFTYEYEDGKSGDDWTSRETHVRQVPNEFRPDTRSKQIIARRRDRIHNRRRPLNSSRHSLGNFELPEHPTKDERKHAAVSSRRHRRLSRRAKRLEDRYQDISGVEVYPDKTKAGKPSKKVQSLIDKRKSLILKSEAYTRQKAANKQVNREIRSDMAGTLREDWGDIKSASATASRKSKRAFLSKASKVRSAAQKTRGKTRPKGPDYASIMHEIRNRNSTIDQDNEEDDN